MLFIDYDVSWQYDAACLGLTSKMGVDLFFRPEDGKTVSSRVKKAKTFCANCTVKQECLRFALDNDTTGIWGGTTERERKRMKNAQDT